MKQRHSYTDLMYHVVMRTKNREHFIFEPEEKALLTFMKKKAHDLDAWLEEFGAWNDHVHILLRTRPTIALSDVYRQLKGFRMKEQLIRPGSWKIAHRPSPNGVS